MTPETDDRVRAEQWPLPHWHTVEPFPREAAAKSFVSGTAAADRTPITYFRDGDRLRARVWFGPPTEGPPRSVHGGALAAVLDEAMGAVCWMQGYPVLGARITVNYLQRTPLEITAWVEAWIERIDGRKLVVAARLTNAAGARYADSEGLFVRIAFPGRPRGAD